MVSAGATLETLETHESVAGSGVMIPDAVAPRRAPLFAEESDDDLIEEDDDFDEFGEEDDEDGEEDDFEDDAEDDGEFDDDLDDLDEE